MQRVGDMAEEMKRVRAQMEDDEQLSSLMRGLRGQNLSDTQFATSTTRMRLIEVRPAPSAILTISGFFLWSCDKFSDAQSLAF